MREPIRSAVGVGRRPPIRRKVSADEGRELVDSPFVFHGVVRGDAHLQSRRLKGNEFSDLDAGQAELESSAACLLWD